MSITATAGRSASQIEQAALEAFNNAKDKGHIDLRFEQAQTVAEGLYILLEQQEDEKKKLQTVLKQERIQVRDLQTELRESRQRVESLKEEVEQYEEIDRTLARESAFVSASDLPLQPEGNREQQEKSSPTSTSIWIYIVNMINLWQKQRGAVALAEKEPKWNPSGQQLGRKVFFNLDEEGQITGVSLEK